MRPQRALCPCMAVVQFLRQLLYKDYHIQNWINGSHVLISHQEMVQRSSLCSGQPFDAGAEQYMKQHVRADKRLQAAKESWGEPADIEAVKEVFCKFVDGSAPSPWAETTPSTSVAALAPKLKAIIAKGYLPINALPMV